MKKTSVRMLKFSEVKENTTIKCENCGKPANKYLMFESNNNYLCAECTLLIGFEGLELKRRNNERSILNFHDSVNNT